jgi:hypothetical protein
MWQDGAVFDTVLNRYTSSAFPTGIDPRAPGSLQVFASTSSEVLLNNSSNARLSNARLLDALQDVSPNGTLAVTGSMAATALPLDTS